jgi:membrane-associated phospholipid phosphatase
MVPIRLAGVLLRHTSMLIVVFSLSATTGCGTLANGRRWGQDAFSRVGPKTVTHAAQDAFFDLQTLLPAAGAIIFAASDLDQEVSDWATDHTPLFGSQETAQEVSDYLRGTLWAEAFATLIATPSGSEAEPWLDAKAKGLAVEGLAIGVTAGVTQGLKQLTDRTRPDGTDDLSFPSGHASSSFAAAILANRNLASIPLSPWVKYSLHISNILLASGAAWGRVEGGQHFPSDVLAGAALGHFLSAFIHDACIGIPKADRFQLVIMPSKGGAMAYLYVPF